MTARSQKNYAICDSAIAIARTDFDNLSIIHIHPIYTKHYDNADNKKRNCDSSSYDVDTLNSRKLRYSENAIENQYSSRFMSLSKDGRYLAMSWLPNPLLGVNISMKYCMIFDLTDLPCDNNPANPNMPLTMPMRIIEFYGGCVFTEENNFVLINQSEVRVYDLTYNHTLKFESFEIKFSLNLLNTNDCLSPAYNYDHMPPTYFLFPLAADRSQNTIPQSSNQRNKDVFNHDNSTPRNSKLDNFDDIFYDGQNSEEYSDDDYKEYDEEDKKFEADAGYMKVENDICFDETNDLFYEDQDDDMPSDNLEVIKSIDSSDTEEPLVKVFEHNDTQLYKTKMSASAQSQKTFNENDEFVRINMDNVKQYGVICCVTPCLQVGEEAQKNNLLVWNLYSRKLIHYKQLDDSGKYLTAFSKGASLVAISKRYIENDYTKPCIEPVVNVYDCESGLTVLQLTIPAQRPISGVIQVLFIQNDCYIMTVSFVLNKFFMDIWDTGTGIHLDCCTTNIDSTTICMQESQFILHNDIELRYGCGVFIRAEYPSFKGPLHEDTTRQDKSIEAPPKKDYLSTSSTNIQIHRISFFESDYNHSCASKSTILYELTQTVASSKDKHMLIQKREKANMPFTIPIKTVSKPGWPAYFLNREETYLMTCEKEPVDIYTFTMTIWNVTTDKSHVCKPKGNDYSRTITLKHVVYSFVYTNNDTVSGMTGYPSTFLNLARTIRLCISRIKPIIIIPSDKDGTPVLLMKINDPFDGTNYSLSFQKDYDADSIRLFSYTMAIPLHRFSLLECHLHALANERRTMGYSYDKFLNIPILVSKEDDLKTTLKNLIQLIDSNSDYFTTLAGYSALCLLARDDMNYKLLKEVFKPANKINYCSIAVQEGDTYYVTDILTEALNGNAIENTKLIVSHLKHSVSTSGTRNGTTLLLKNRSLIAQNDN